MAKVGFLAIAGIVGVACGSTGSPEQAGTRAESIAELLGVPKTADEAAALFFESRRQINEDISLCMRQEGFDYLPPNPEETIDLGPGFDLPPEEFASLYGFGISTTYEFQSITFTEELIGSDELSPLGREFASIEEESAFWVALTGSDGTSGCTASAESAALSRTSPQVEATKAVDEYLQRVQADPKVMELERRQSECRFDATGFSQEHEAESHVYELLSQIDAANSAFVSTSAEAGATGQAPVPEEVSDRLVSLQADEIAIAEAFVACANEVSTELQKIEEQYETEFLEQWYDE